MSEGAKSESKSTLGALTGTAKFALGFIILSQLPLAWVILNNAFQTFETDSSPYYLMHVIERVRLGGSVYVPLGPGVASPTYTPLYFWISAFLCKLFGTSMVWPRLLNIVCTLGYGFVTGLFVWKRTQRDVLLSVAAALFALSSFGFIGSWHTDIQVNGMQAMLAVTGFYLLTADRLTVRRVLLVGVIMFLSLFTKQTALAYAVAAAAVIFYRSYRLGAIYTVFTVAIILAAGFAMNAATDGEFVNNTLLGASAAPWVLQRIWTEILFPQLLGHLGLLCFMTLLPIFIVASRKDFWDTVFKPEYIMCAAGLGVTLIAQPKIGSGAVQAVVAYAGLAVCGCIGLYQLKKLLPGNSGLRFVAVLICIQMVVQLLPLTKNFKADLVDDHDHLKFEQVSEVFKAGRACMINYAYLPTMFGQPDAGQYGDDRTMWKNGVIDYTERPANMADPFKQQEFDFVILNKFSDQRDPAIAAILQNYTPIRAIPAHPNGPQGGNLRYEYIVLHANRLRSQQAPGE